MEANAAFCHSPRSLFPLLSSPVHLFCHPLRSASSAGAAVPPQLQLFESRLFHPIAYAYIVSRATNLPALDYFEFIDIRYRISAVNGSSSRSPAELKLAVQRKIT